MIYADVFSPRAQKEYDDALYWYLQRSHLAAVNFVKEVDKVTAMICAHPYRWRRTDCDYRELGLDKYPYSIIYRIDDVQPLVIILSVFHNSRDPKQKYNEE